MIEFFIYPSFIQYSQYKILCLVRFLLGTSLGQVTVFVVINHSTASRAYKHSKAGYSMVTGQED